MSPHAFMLQQYSSLCFVHVSVQLQFFRRRRMNHKPKSLIQREPGFTEFLRDTQRHFRTLIDLVVDNNDYSIIQRLNFSWERSVKYRANASRLITSVEKKRVDFCMWLKVNYQTSTQFVQGFKSSHKDNSNSLRNRRPRTICKYVTQIIIHTALPCNMPHLAYNIFRDYHSQTLHKHHSRWTLCTEYTSLRSLGRALWWLQ